MADTILETIADYARVRVGQARAQIPPEEMRRQALRAARLTGFPFEKALSGPKISDLSANAKKRPLPKD